MPNYNEPLVSVCIPVRNGGQFIKDALDSIVNQDYKNIEIIVSDNASTDKTPDIVRGYTQRYGVKYYRSENYLGAAEYNFNRCLELATGELISIYHADDTYNPDIISRSVEVLNKYKNVGAVFTLANRIDEKGKFMGRYKLPPELKKLNKHFYNFDEIFACVLKYGNTFLFCPSVMVRRSVYEKVGTWEYEKYGTASDLGLWLKILQKYNISIIDFQLMSYRKSAMQIISNSMKIRTDRGPYLTVTDYYLDKIKGHKYEKYYNLHKIIDLAFRSLNLAADRQLDESNDLIKEVFSIYAKNFFKITPIFKAVECMGVISVLALVNKVHNDAIRASFRDLVFKLRGIRQGI